MKRVLQYIMTLNQTQALVMPAGAEILRVGEIRGELRMWALADERQTETERRAFFLAGNGDYLPDNYGRYIGTVCVAGLPTIHVFEVRP